MWHFDGINPVGYTSIQKRYDAAFVKLGMEWRSTHIFRHSFATDFLEKTKDKPALQGQLGHKTSKQTDHYAKITETSVKDGVKAYNARLRGELLGGAG